MADEYMSLKEACKELQMNEAQVLALVSAGQLKSVQIEGEMRFGRAAMAEFKQRAESRETVVMGAEDLARAQAAGEELEEEEDTDIAEGPPEKAAKVDLSDIEEEAGADESDQTSVLRPVAEAGAPKEQVEEPIFQFEEDESTSFMSEERAKAAQARETPKAAAPKAAGAKGEEVELAPTEEPGHTEIVADILKQETGTGEEDDSLETVDLAELEGGAEGSSAETQLVGEEAPGIGEEETIGLEGTQAETEGVEGGLLDVTEERIEEEEEEGEPVRMAPEAAAMPMVDYVAVRASVMANVFLALSILLVLFAGFLVVCTMFELDRNPVAKVLYDLLKNLV
jgi:hypothetical protein